MNLIEPIMKAAKAANAEQPGDYRKDGLLHCGSCHSPKECRKVLMGKEVVVSCMCSCAEEKYKKDEADRRKRDDAERIMRLRSTGISSQSFRSASFEADDGKCAAPMAILRNYSQKWEDMKRENIGLLLYGGVGSGKSYGAACIANCLIEQYTPVCMINLATVLNSLGGFQSEEKNAYIADLMRYPLLILDDFGMERQTEYALEQVFNVIDARYRTKKPLIITTNLSLEEINNPKTRDHARIYDRIREMCQPVNFGSGGRRMDLAREKMQKARILLQGTE